MTHSYVTVLVESDATGSHQWAAITPDCIMREEPADPRYCDGDIVIGADGHPWLITIDGERCPVSAAVDIAVTPRGAIQLNEIDLPATIVLRDGEPVQVVVE